MKRYAILVAAGTGSRMKSELPKQFLILRGKPVLAFSIEAFFAHDPETTILVVLAPSEMDRWKSLCAQYAMHIPHVLVAGGATRTESVRNGLLAITEPCLVAIHDGARPLVTPSVIEQSFQSALHHGSGVACILPKDSLRKVSGNSNTAVNRDTLRLIQTPQTFQKELIDSAYARFGNEASTDDATVAEKAGFAINLTEGSYANIKITTPEDLVMAEALLNFGL